MSMTRAETILKWVVYSMALGLTALTQFFVMGPILQNTIPLLIPGAVAALAVLEGAVAGAGFGMAAGLLQYGLTHTSPLWVAGLSLTGWLVGLLTQYVLRRDLVGFLLSGLLALALFQVGQVLWGRLVCSIPWTALLTVAAREALWTALLSPLMYGLFLSCCRRYGRIQYE